MKYEDNSVHIGNKNKIKNSSIGKKSQIKNTKNENNESERWYSKLFWKIFIPVVVVVIATAICLWLGLK
jgi:anti-sigma-K factor RskA